MRMSTRVKKASSRSISRLSPAPATKTLCTAFAEVFHSFRTEFSPEPAHKVHRSEEHTSELQSLMRSSYAVFCLKTTKQITPLPMHTTKQTTNYNVKHTYKHYRQTV